MKKIYPWFTVVAILVLLVSPTVMIQADTTLTGKDFVKIGKMGALAGSLLEDDAEWYLKTHNGAIYDLHFGNHDHRAKTGIRLEVGKQATVTGYIYENNMAVCAINLDGQTYRFRKDDGAPLWAGSGNNQNAQ